MHQLTEPAVDVAPSPDVMLPHRFRIDKYRKDTADTFTVDLVPVNPDQPFMYQPGQFNMIYIFGVGEAPISISGDPATAPKLVHTTRVVGTVTTAMRGLGVGHELGIRGPFGRPWPTDHARGHDVVLVAGGIGLAPLRPVLYHVLANRSDYGKLVLLYGTRTPADILYQRELQQWRSRLDMEVFVTVDRATPGWRGNVDVVTTLIPKAPFDPLNTVAMICGPEIMMRFAAIGLLKRGVPANHLYVSLERNMKCAVGFCGHCQLSREFVCRDGPVFPYDRVRDLMMTREL